jgi:hypothetical protein
LLDYLAEWHAGGASGSASKAMHYQLLQLSRALGDFKLSNAPVLAKMADLASRTAALLFQQWASTISKKGSLRPLYLTPVRLPNRD